MGLMQAKSAAYLLAKTQTEIVYLDLAQIFEVMFGQGFWLSKVWLL